MRSGDALQRCQGDQGPGAERILAFLGQGAIVGELSIIDGQPRSATVVAVRGATVSFLSRADFEACAEKHPEVYKSLVKILTQRLRETDTVVAASSFLSLKGRVARAMLELAGHFGQEVGLGRIVSIVAGQINRLEVVRRGLQATNLVRMENVRRKLL